MCRLQFVVVQGLLGCGCSIYKHVIACYIGSNRNILQGLLNEWIDGYIPTSYTQIIQIIMKRHCSGTYSCFNSLSMHATFIRDIYNNYPFFGWSHHHHPSFTFPSNSNENLIHIHTYILSRRKITCFFFSFFCDFGS